MKRKILAITLTCMMAMSADAQVYSGDTWAQLPTADLYDTGVMNMYFRALAETEARRKANYQYYSDLALEACRNKQWNNVVYYVTEALNTEYYSGEIYYIRGYAYEQLGNLRAAKKDYRKSRRLGYSQATRAMESLKAKKKRR